MNRRARMLAVLVLLAGVFYYMKVLQKPPPPKATPTAVASVKPSFVMNQVLVAKANLNPVESSSVTGDKVEVRTDFPPDMIPKDSAKTFTDIEGLVLTAPIYQGEIVLKSRFMSPFDVREKKLGDFLKQGYRAMTVEVDDITGSAGFISQGDHVDIVAYYRIPQSDRQITRIIVQNVIVLAKGTTFTTKPQRMQPGAIHGVTGQIRVTLLVEPRMAARLAQIFDQRGQNRFRLILRNPTDKTEAQTHGVLLQEVLTGLSRTQVHKTQVEETPIEILKGQAKTNEYNLDLGQQAAAGEVGGPGRGGAAGAAAGGPGGEAGAPARGGAQGGPPVPGPGEDNLLGMQ